MFMERLTLASASIQATPARRDQPDALDERGRGIRAAKRRAPEIQAPGAPFAGLSVNIPIGLRLFGFSRKFRDVR
jgi:hypothetical protein